VVLAMALEEGQSRESHLFGRTAEMVEHAVVEVDPVSSCQGECLAGQTVCDHGADVLLVVIIFPKAIAERCGLLDEFDPCRSVDDVAQTFEESTSREIA
jgi:hypothetical protein